MRSLAFALALVSLVGCASLRDGPLPGRHETNPFATVASLPDFAVELSGCPVGDVVVSGDFAQDGVDYRLFATERRWMLIDFASGIVWLGDVQGEGTQLVTTLTLPLADAAQRFPHPCDWLAPGVRGPTA
jgi:hypothetical protein